MRANLISGKLSQPTQTLHVTRATHRSFQKEDWTQLEKRLVAWRSELNNVLDVLKHTKSTQKTRVEHEGAKGIQASA